MNRLTRIEAAARLGIGLSTLDKRVKAGKIPYYKAEGRTSKITFNAADVDRYMESLKVTHTPPTNIYNTFRKRRDSA